MSPYAGRQSTGKMTNRPHFAHIQGNNPFSAELSKRFRQLKKSTNPNLLGKDVFRWGEGLPCERVGAKRFGRSLETQ